MSTGLATRALSYSEISTALTCEARHAFQYTGHLTDGRCLKPKQLAPVLGNGRAWGAAVAAWHAFSREESLLGIYDPTLAKFAAHGALRASYAHDIAEQAELGISTDPETQVQREGYLSSVLDHYMATAKVITGLCRLEDELLLPIPSRTGRQGSSRYRFQGFIDGFVEDEYGNEWVVEFKLRRALTPLELIQISSQVKWYAWARQQESGRRVVGVMVDERLAEAPKKPRLVRPKRKTEGVDGLIPSHAKDQLCTPRDYRAVCEEFGVEPNADTLQALGERKWQQRIEIPFLPDELEEAGKELVSAAQLIRDLDSGVRYPIRNGQPHICRGCRFLKACPAPHDEVYLETIYEYTEPKRLRTPESGRKRIPKVPPGQTTIDDFLGEGATMELDASSVVRFGDSPEAPVQTTLNVDAPLRSDFHVTVENWGEEHPYVDRLAEAFAKVRGDV